MTQRSQQWRPRGDDESIRRHTHNDQNNNKDTGGTVQLECEHQSEKEDMPNRIESLSNAMGGYNIIYLSLIGDQ